MGQIVKKLRTASEEQAPGVSIEVVRRKLEISEATYHLWNMESGGACFIEPGSPWQNACIEIFNSRLRDELRNLEPFGRVLGEGHRDKYIRQRAHSSLNSMTPTELASRNPSPLRPASSAPKNCANSKQPNLSDLLIQRTGALQPRGQDISLNHSSHKALEL
jgi:hypothetical protein